jgi:CheY-like chemotaxis protein/HPt (histidine-containing phosphotransfer) domain-containing protein
MGGRMWVESEEGVGTTFNFTMQAEAVPDQTYRYLHEVQPQLNDKQVLIVDDNATNRHILTLQLQSWGMQPAVTASPVEALEWVRRGDPFDLAILDMQMPEMDGLMLATEIRRERDAQMLPLVMLTSLGGRETLSSAGLDAANFAAFMTKPLKPSHLFDALVNIFNEQPTRIRRRREPTGEAAFDPEMGQRMPLRILLAEDHATNQKLALMLLQRLGYRADVAANGLEALEALERQPYDVILMDMQMPEMDGLEATHHILQRWPGEHRPRIIAMTANAMEGDRESYLAAGMDDYVSKPIRVEELVRALNESHPKTMSNDGEPSATKNFKQSFTQVSQTEESAGDTSQILDPDAVATLLELVGGEKALVVELIDSFLEEAPPLFTQLRNSVEQSDAAGLRMAAHTLKSSSTDFGATTLAELCRELEEMGKNGTLEGAAELVAQAEAEYERVQTGLETVRDE